MNQPVEKSSEAKAVPDKSIMDGTVQALQGAMDEVTEKMGGASEAVQKELKEELDHIIDAANYLKSNWKVAVPAIAAVGVGAYLYSIRGKSPSIKKVFSQLKNASLSKMMGGKKSAAPAAAKSKAKVSAGSKTTSKNATATKSKSKTTSKKR